MTVPTAETSTAAPEASVASVVTNADRLDRALLQAARAWEASRGELALLCVPGMVDTHVRRLEMLAAVLGYPFSVEELGRVRATVEQQVAEGFAASPYSQLLVRYGPAHPPHKGLVWDIRPVAVSYSDRAKLFLQYRPPQDHERYPDAKVMDLAATLQPAAAAPVLDVGAGTGRNAIPLARRGHPVDAIEFTPEMLEVLGQSASDAGVAIDLLNQDIRDPAFAPRANRYALIVLSGVVQYFNDPALLHQLLGKLAPSLRPGGQMVLDCFVATEGYEPTPLARQLSYVTDSFLLTPPELAEAIAGLPLQLVSDESALDYERAHLSPTAWAARAWLDSWATGDRLFALNPDERPPLSLRWLVYERPTATAD
jgi:2-polyprenyl-3-methyl-5-hydroxy-6-metoxy-1,4-benzoquinol methylase